MTLNVQSSLFAVVCRQQPLSVESFDRLFVYLLLITSKFQLDLIGNKFGKFYIMVLKCLLRNYGKALFKLDLQELPVNYR